MSQLYHPGAFLEMSIATVDAKGSTLSIQRAGTTRAGKPTEPEPPRSADRDAAALWDDFNFRFAGLGLQPAADLLHEVDGAAGITPFVVVPAHEFEEVLVQLDAAAGVE